MSYLVLARKSRPQRFADVIGQKAVVRTLKNALEQERVAHALIFSGVRGTGKTTLARIMAKALNCEHREGAEPCNECPSCLEIAKGTSVDLQEVDGASNRGIQEIRELKERIRFQPSAARFKIFIIDEVHMLTTEAFNALLKTLEEPPEHVYFMFATTELHKVPLTILSRCQRFELKRLSLAELKEHFGQLAAQEGVSISPDALDMVAREAAGSVRDGLSLLDQVFSYCGDGVTAEDVNEVLGLVSRRSVAELGTALLQANLTGAMQLLDALQDQGLDLKRLSGDLLGWFRELLLCKLGPKTASMLGLPADEVAALNELVRPVPEAQLAALFNLLMDAMEQRHNSREPRLALEMAFIRATQVAEIAPTADLISRFNALLGDAPLPAVSAAPAPMPAIPVAAARIAPQVPGQSAMIPETPAPRPLSPKPVPEPHPAITPGAEPLPEKTAQKSASGEGKTRKGKGQQTPSQAPAAVHDAAEQPEAPQSTASPREQPASKAPVLQGELAERVSKEWSAFASFVQNRVKWMGLSLEKSLSVRLEADTLVPLFRDQNDCIMLKQPEHLRTLAGFAQEFFQAPLKLRIAEESRADEINPRTGRSRLEESKALATDSLVLTALEVFGGQLGEIRTGASATEVPSEPGEDDAFPESFRLVSEESVSLDDEDD